MMAEKAIQFDKGGPKKSSRSRSQVDHVIVTVLHSTRAPLHSRSLLEATDAIVHYHHDNHRSKYLSLCTGDANAHVLLRATADTRTLMNAITLFIRTRHSVDILQALNVLYDAYQVGSVDFRHQRIIIFAGLIDDTFPDNDALRHITKALKLVRFKITIIQIGNVGPALQQVMYLINGKCGNRCSVIELNPLEDNIGYMCINEVFRRSHKSKKLPVELVSLVNDFVDDDDDSVDRPVDWRNILMFVQTTDDEPSTSGGYRSHLKRKLSFVRKHWNASDVRRREYNRRLEYIIQTTLDNSRFH